MKKYANRTADRIMAPELQSSAKGGVQVVARQQVSRDYRLLNGYCVQVNYGKFFQYVTVLR